MKQYKLPARLPDESGILWTIFESDDDPIYQVLKIIRSTGFELETLTLPDELPRFCRVDDPQWGPVIALWEASGDSPEFRRRACINQIRRVMNQPNDELYKHRPGSTGEPPLQAERIA